MRLCNRGKSDITERSQKDAQLLIFLAVPTDPELAITEKNIYTVLIFRGNKLPANVFERKKHVDMHGSYLTLKLGNTLVLICIFKGGKTAFSWKRFLCIS